MIEVYSCSDHALSNGNQPLNFARRQQMDRMDIHAVHLLRRGIRSRRDRKASGRWCKAHSDMAQAPNKRSERKTS